MTRIDLAGTDVYINDVRIEATKVHINLISGDEQEVQELGGTSYMIKTTPDRYVVVIDDHLYPEPEVTFWKDAEAYLASQQYQIYEMELP